VYCHIISIIYFLSHFKILRLVALCRMSGLFSSEIFLGIYFVLSKKMTLILNRKMLLLLVVLMQLVLCDVNYMSVCRRTQTVHSKENIGSVKDGRHRLRRVDNGLLVVLCRHLQVS